jgi:hypothetical protein
MIKFMTESDYWLSLEFRVCQEFAGMPQHLLRFRWCDGFVPSDYRLDGPTPCITGCTWICDGPKQEEYNFTLLLNSPVPSCSEIDWESLLPSANTTKWMAVDLVRKHIQIEPSAGVPIVQG